MNTPPGGRAAHPLLWTLAVFIAVAVVVAGYLRVCTRVPPISRGQARGAGGVSRARIPTGVPAELKSASLIERGEYLTRAADCMVCHTAQGGAPLRRRPRLRVAVRHAVFDQHHTRCRDGHRRLHRSGFFGRRSTRASAAAIPSFTPPCRTRAIRTCRMRMRWRSRRICFRLKPLHAPGAAEFPGVSVQPARPHEPLVRRCSTPIRATSPTSSAAPSGIGAHTSRRPWVIAASAIRRETWALRLNNRQKFAGAVQAGWRAYNITPDRNSGVGAWSDADLLHYLSTGTCRGAGHARRVPWAKRSMKA